MEAAAKRGVQRLPAEPTQQMASESAGQLPPEQSSTATPDDNFSSNAQDNATQQATEVPPTGEESTLFDPDSFSDLPEEWMMNDWTLFGAPLSAYHSVFNS